MANCVLGEVRLIIETSLSDANITALIVLADAEITARSMDSRPANVLKTISMFLTAAIIAGRDPKSYGLGEYRQTSMTAMDWRGVAEKQILLTSPMDVFGLVGLEPLPSE